MESSISDKDPRHPLTDDSFVVVGVISDQLDSFLGFREDYPQIFIPYTVAPLANSLIVSTALPASDLLNQVRQAVYSIDKDQPIVDATTLRQMLDMYGYACPRFTLALFGTFAAAALLLATAVTMIANLAADLAYAWLDPRVTLR